MIASLPNINVSGNRGANATSKPPKPHPISTTSTSLLNFAGLFESSDVLSIAYAG